MSGVRVAHLPGTADAACPRVRCAHLLFLTASECEARGAKQAAVGRAKQTGAAGA
ncbi:hypothetical protein [Idiomarina aquatica]|uniref:hypothetical protein n=1 Tax=Idiomarina aquatica TaxID=1327752 RepID=UPI00130024EC|nr:hypothetical protein [Idiomarina aquatica]